MGILFTALGFGLTWQEANEAKKSAAQATTEVEKLRETVRSVRAVEDVSATIRLLEEIKDWHRIGGETGWKHSLSRYTEVHSRIVRIRGDLNTLSPLQEEAFTAIIVELSRIEQEVDKALPVGDLDLLRLDYVSYNSAIQRFVDVLNELSVRLRQQMGA